MCYGVLSARNCHDRLRQDKPGLTVRSGTVLRAKLPSKQNRSQLKQDKYPQSRRLHHSLGAFLCRQTSALSADCGVGKRAFKGCPWWIFPLVWLLTPHHYHHTHIRFPSENGSQWERCYALFFPSDSIQHPQGWKCSYDTLAGLISI